MKFNSYSLIIICLFYWSCTTTPEQIVPNSQNPHAAVIPDTLLIKGTDTDYSYITLQTIHESDSLRIECTGWGIEEMGMLLLCKQVDNSYIIELGAKCGTMESRTPVKRTFTDRISRAMEDSLANIVFVNNNDSLKIVRK